MRIPQWTITAVELVALSVLPQAVFAQANGAKDYSAQPAVIESFVCTAAFENNGTYVAEVSARIRLQAQAAIQSYGLLRFPYPASTTDTEIIYVRVVKPDGKVTNTPTENTLEMPADITRQAPFYSDIKEKQIAVTNLEVGDVLEYRVRFNVRTPLITGQFWYEYDFFKDDIVLREELQISVPASRPIKTHSATIQPVITEANGRKTYAWKSSNLRSKAMGKDDYPQPTGPPPPPDVLISSFQSWDEVGRWFRGLMDPRIAPTPEIIAKAQELTRGLAGDTEKTKALYAYVSTKFRYIGVAFGIGRYQPHSAAEVLGNRYGDCKDKHTLLASLLAAIGVKSYPALVNVSRKIEPEVPSPAQFDHVITAVPRASEFLWLDTTAEVAPFGFLVRNVRGKQALPVPDSPNAAVVKLPSDPPFPSSFTFQIEGKLDASGTLEAKARASFRGDVELDLRAAFRGTSAAEWKDVVQRLSQLWGFGGTVSEVDISSPEATDEAFHLNYSYSRKDYSDWSNHRITPPLPPLLLAELPEDSARSPDPIALDSPGEFRFEAKVELPKGFIARAPAPVAVKNEFAEYSTEYSLSGSTLRAFRRLTIRAGEMPRARQEEYVALRKALLDDQDRYILVADPSITAASALGIAGESNPQAAQMLVEAQQALFRKEFESALKSINRALELNPHSAMAFRMKASIFSYLKRPTEEMEAWRGLIQADPDDPSGPLNFGLALYRLKRYAEAIPPLESANERLPSASKIDFTLARAYARSGQTEKALETFKKILEAHDSAGTLNNIADELAEDNVGLDQALQYAERAVKEDSDENNTISVSLEDLDSKDLARMESLADDWDTLGWVHFRLGHFEKAEKYLKASWILAQDPVMADHLGQLYDSNRNGYEAAHFFALSLASGGSAESTRRRLVAILGTDARADFAVKTAKAELSHLQTVKITRPSQTNGSADFFLLFDQTGRVIAVKFIKGDSQFRSATRMLAAKKYNLVFPDDHPTKFARRALLSCGPDAATCDLIFVTTSSNHTVD